MAFSYAVIRHDADGWHVSINNYAQTEEITTKTLPDLCQKMQQAIKLLTQQVPP